MGQLDGGYEVADSFSGFQSCVASLMGNIPG